MKDTVFKCLYVFCGMESSPEAISIKLARAVLYYNYNCLCVVDTLHFSLFIPLAFSLREITNE